MLNVTKVDNSIIMNSTEETDAVNNMLKTMPGINIPGLYDNYFITVDTKLNTVQWAMRLNFEENVLFRNELKMSKKDELLISLAEAIAYIYTATPPNMQQRIPTVISSVDNIISVLNTFLVEDTNITFKSIFEKLIIPKECPSWEAYIDEPYAKKRHQFLFNTYATGKFTNDHMIMHPSNPLEMGMFVDIRYSSIPIKEWFIKDSIVNNGVSDYRCIETIYFSNAENNIVDTLLSNLRYKVSMCGEVNGYFAVTFNITGHPTKEDIELIKSSYARLGF